MGRSRCPMRPGSACAWMRTRWRSTRVTRMRSACRDAGRVHRAVTRVGFIGLGNMGGPMCGHLAAAGYSVSAFDLDAAALARAVDSGARAASGVAECARQAEVLITMLPAPPQVEQVLLGADGAIAALAPGSLAIDMSTSSTAVGARVVAAASERGVEVLDAPVAGQSIGAQAGTLAIYVGGPREAFERALPLFAAMGDPDRIFHLGS